LPLRDDPARPGRRLLVDRDGALLARFAPGLREGWPVADLFTRLPGVGVERVVARVLEDLQGTLVCGDPELGRALVAAGGRPGRHAHLLSRDHPDFLSHPYPEDPALDLAPLLDGRQVGPLLGASALAVDDRDRVVGAAIVNRAGGTPPEAGPWLSQLFRAPTHRGAGRALLEHVLAALTAAGEEALGLTVTDGNPAERLYRALGFQLAFNAYNVHV
jgi:GNAT superfamily N-acetyltransferase